MNGHAMVALRSSGNGIFGENSLNICKKIRAIYPFVLRATLHFKHCLTRAEVSIVNCPALDEKCVVGVTPQVEGIGGH